MKDRYFCTDLTSEEIVLTIDEIVDMMASEEYDEVEAYKAEPVPGNGTFYCEWDGQVSEWSPGICGRHCKGYLPINGVSGKCKNKELTYISTGPAMIIKADGSTKEIEL